MDLISKSDRDNLDLNSWERAIIWSALTLRASNVAYADNPQIEGYAYENSVRIALAKAIVDGALTASLRIDATLPYARAFAIASGGDFVSWIKELYTGPAVQFTGDSCSVLVSEGYGVSGDGGGLPVEPPYVLTLEQYFLWACWQAELSLLNPLPSQLLPITVDFFEESQPDPTIKVVANIPIDYLLYKDSENLVCSCLPLSSQISPAGLRSFSWQEITGKPTFDDVAYSGNYNDLINIPSIPSSLEELNRFNELVRTINGEAPDPNTGNVDLTLDVGSVDWTNVNNKPTWNPVAFSGDYADLTNTPSIPDFTWYTLPGKPAFADVAYSGDYNDLTNTPTITELDWGNITNKPTWATVAFSGSYNDLTDKPDLSGGSSEQRFLGKKTMSAITSSTLYFTDEASLNGIIDWVGTNENTEAFSNPQESGKIIISNIDSPQFTNRWFNKNINDEYGFPVSNPGNVNTLIDFTNYEVNPSKISFYARINTTGTAEYAIEGSLDNNNWIELGTISFTTTAAQWNTVDLSENGFFKYLRLEVVSEVGTIVVYIRQIELWGEIRTSSSVANGSLEYDLQLSDINYLLVPDLSVGTINLLPLSTLNLNVGDRFFAYNPHPFNLLAVPHGSDQLNSSNNLSVLSQGQSVELVKVSSTDWFAF